MNPFEMVVLIVAIVAIAGVLRARLLAAGRSERPDPAHAAETAALREELRQVKARVATLERILTDRSQRLADEIDRLRDPH